MQTLINNKIVSLILSVLLTVFFIAISNSFIANAVQVTPMSSIIEDETKSAEELIVTDDNNDTYSYKKADNDSSLYNYDTGNSIPKSVALFGILGVLAAMLALKNDSNSKK